MERSRSSRFDGLRRQMPEGIAAPAVEVSLHQWGLDLSARTPGDCIREVEKLVSSLKTWPPVEALRPEHFSAYMKHIIEIRKRGRYPRGGKVPEVKKVGKTCYDR